MKAFLEYLQAVLELMRRYWYVCLGIGVIGATLVFSPLVFTYWSTRGERYDLMKVSVNEVPRRPVAIVFGGGIFQDGSPTPYLKNRLDTAAKLYKADRVDMIVVSGDNSTHGYNEPDVMYKYLVSKDIAGKDVVADYAGFNTYDTCYRAYHVFGLDEAVLITQGYHLPRAMVTCEGLGVKNIGVAALHKGRDFTVTYIIREFISTDKMVLQNIFKPTPTVLGQPQPIN